MDHTSETSSPDRLLLGPFCGKPACQFINVTPGKARGVCAEAFLQRKTLRVPEVELYPGHIACDAETKSEIVCPLILLHGEQEMAVGVMDLDCLAIAGFDEEDQFGLQKIAKLIVEACDW
jgi:L-methionine (R)-S-oxide reductase